MPRCSRPCDVYSRIVGYLSTRKQWNEGKKAEAEDRLEYKVPIELDRSISEQTKKETEDVND